MSGALVSWKTTATGIQLELVGPSQEGSIECCVTLRVMLATLVFMLSDLACCCAGHGGGVFPSKRHFK